MSSTLRVECDAGVATTNASSSSSEVKPAQSFQRDQEQLRIRHLGVGEVVLPLAAEPLRVLVVDDEAAVGEAQGFHVGGLDAGDVALAAELEEPAADADEVAVGE